MLDNNKLISEAKFNFSRSGGKGGQNVNKVETKVELVFNIKNSNTLDEVQKEVLMKKIYNKLDKDGNIRIVSQSERFQLANRKSAVKKFLDLIHSSLKKKKKRIKMHIPENVKKEILRSKKKLSEKKMRRKERIMFEE